jgi:hypothetical protein
LNVEAWQWVLVIAVVVVALAVIAWAASRSRYRARVMQNFGPEYDRAVEQHGTRRAAEHDLMDRVKRRQHLEIRPLAEDARVRYSDEWRIVQAHFVDQPEAAFDEADRLLDQVMRDRGYPVDSRDENVELVSVDHPNLIADYRAARAVRARSTTRMASTEELREGLLRYRSLFNDLLSDRDERATAGRTTTEERQ